MSRTASAYPGSQKDTAGLPRTSSSYPSDIFTRRRVETLEGRYVRSTRFASISQATGAITPPSQSQIILNDFGGTIDAVVSTIDSGRPTLNPAYTAGGLMVTASFDGSGNYVLSGTPSAYPVAVLYRVRTPLKYYNDEDTDICGPSTLEALPAIYDFLSLTDTPDSYVGKAGNIAAVDPTETKLIFLKKLILEMPIISKSADFTADDTMLVVECTNAITVTLPDASTCIGRPYYIVNVDGATKHIVDASGKQINDALFFDSTSVADSVQLVAKATGWRII